MKSIRSLHLLVKTVEQRGTFRKKQQSRSRKVFSIVDQTMKEIYQVYGGELSQLTIRELCIQRGITCSSQTVHRVLSSPLWKRIQKVLIPTNTPRHRAFRLEFCNKYYNSSFGGDNEDTLWIDIDEKIFINLAQKIVYVPRELEHTVKFAHVASKTPLEKVMFFGAVAKPRPNRDFDGRILLMPVCKKRLRKRKSKYGKVGDVMYERVTMTTKMFIEYCISYLVPAIRQHLIRLPEVKKVIVQLDQAGGHRGGRRQIQPTLDKLTVLAKKVQGKTRGPPICFIAQPSKSPDFNVLDLGIWFSLSCGVPAVKYSEGRMIDRIIHNVLHHWNSTWDAWNRLRNVFETKQ